MTASSSTAQAGEPLIHARWHALSPAWREDPQPAVQLEPGDVDLWHASLPLRHETQKALHAVLSTDEQARAARFIAPSARRQFVAGRGILRHLLARYTGQPAQALRLSTGPHGKPALAGPSALTFSLSHTEGLLLLAVARNLDVGVDVERVRPIEGVHRVAARCFTAQECAELEAGPEGFLRLWTSRESALKACGLGISQGWDSLRIVRCSRHRAQAVGLGHSCPVRWLTPKSGYVAALATLGTPSRIRYCNALDESLDDFLAPPTSCTFPPGLDS